jgi:NAD(P)H-flavin reductase
MMISGAEMCAGPATWQGRVVHHERRTADLAVLTVETDEPLPYAAGQYVTVQHDRWPRVWRAFSVANRPSPDGLLTLHVRAVPAGWVSSALVRDTQPGSEITIGPAVGTMTSGRLSGRDLVCVAGGTGLAPLKAIVEDVLTADEEAVRGGWGTRRNITLFHGARKRLGLYDMPALREMSADFPWLEVVPVVSEDGRFDGLRGHVADAALAYGDWREHEAVISGPARMTGTALAGLRAAGVFEEQLHFDPVGLENAGLCSSGGAARGNPCRLQWTWTRPRPSSGSFTPYTPATSGRARRRCAPQSGAPGRTGRPLRSWRSVPSWRGATPAGARAAASGARCGSGTGAT